MLSEYTRAADGTLTPMSQPTVTTGVNPHDVVISPDGTSAYVDNFSSDDVSEYDVGSTGALAPKSSATIAAAPVPGNSEDPHGMAISPDGASVYVSDFNDEVIYELSVGAGGVLSAKPAATAPAGTEPSAIVVSPDGKYVYVADADAISQYAVGAGGELSPLSPASVPVAGANALAVSPDGRSVYVDTSDDLVDEFNVEAGGVLALNKSSPDVSTPGMPQGMAIASDGRGLYVAQGGSNDEVAVYIIGAEGVLSTASPATAPVAEGARALVVYPAPAASEAGAGTKAPPTAASAKPSCTISTEGSKVLLLAKAKGAQKHKKPKGKPGTLQSAVLCDQGASLTLTGKATAAIKPNVSKHRKHIKTFQLIAVRGTATAGQEITLAVKLPKAALKSLMTGAHEALTVTLAGSNANGIGTATATIKRLSVRR
jgi:sugar lactone lactonase YvrE